MNIAVMNVRASLLAMLLVFVSQAIEQETESIANKLAPTGKAQGRPGRHFRIPASARYHPGFVPAPVSKP
jgi:hypothetical protein